MARCIASLLVLLWATQPAAASSPNCTWWYETTSHGPAYRNVLDFGAIGDGIHDDTAAIQAAIDYNQTGYSGSNVSRSAAVVYLPYGTYLVSDTLTLWFYTHLVGSAACTPTILLKQSSAGFGGGFKPIIAVNGGFNSSASEHAWWLQYHQIGGHANDLFYTHARNLKIVTQGNNSGAVGIYWGVAQQTSLRNISIDLSAGGAIGIDEGGPGYTVVFQPGLTLGGGGSMEDVAITGGSIGLRVSSSQWTYRNMVITNASTACVSLTQMTWTQAFVALNAADCPVAVQYQNSQGHLILLDSVLGPDLGPVAIATDNVSALYLQNVMMLNPTGAAASVVDAVLPLPPGALSMTVSSWAGGATYIDGQLQPGAQQRASTFLPLPTLAGNPTVPRACASSNSSLNICGGSAEDPSTGLPAAPRPAFIGANIVNAVTQYGAVGDGATDDTAALQAALATGAVVFLPSGTYAVSDTIAMACGAALVGEGLATVALVEAAPGFNASNTTGGFKPMLSTPSNASCTAQLVDIALSSLGPGNDAAVLLDHQAGVGSGLWDVTIRQYFRVGLKARFGPPLTGVAPIPAAPAGIGAAVLSNTHFWIADHNLTDLNEMNCSAPTCVDHRPVGGDLGVQLTSSGPLFLMGTNFEHSGILEYHFAGASNVVATAIQTEGSTLSAQLDNTTLVTIFGTLWGSGTGRGNVTFIASRALGGVNCAAAAGDGTQLLDVSYRAHGVMVKLPALYALLDTVYAINATVGSSWMPVAAMLNTCS